jgi:hypothetical protein
MNTRDETNTLQRRRRRRRDKKKRKTHRDVTAVEGEMFLLARVLLLL